MNKKNKPNFNVLNYGFMISVKGRWRKPRGIDNKKRIRRKPFGKSPKIGYKNSDLIRGNHPSGKREVYIRNPSELYAIIDTLGKDDKGDDKVVDFVIRVAAGLGRKKRADIEKKAKEHKIHILNKLSEKKIKKSKKEKREKKEAAKKLKEEKQKKKNNNSKDNKQKEKKANKEVDESKNKKVETTETREEKETKEVKEIKKAKEVKEAKETREEKGRKQKEKQLKNNLEKNNPHANKLNKL